jgi:hypothetical protein
MSRLRSVIILTATLALCAGATFLRTTRAADDPAHAGTTAGKVQEPARKVQQPAAAKSPPSGPPQVPEESASVRDDPTIAPDVKQSADNNVSFPNDI